VSGEPPAENGGEEEVLPLQRGAGGDFSIFGPPDGDMMFHSEHPRKRRLIRMSSEWQTTHFRAAWVSFERELDALKASARPVCLDRTPMKFLRELGGSVGLTNGKRLIQALATPFIFLIVLLCLSSARAESNGWEEVFFVANQAFKAGQYQHAIEGYRQLVDGGRESGHLYYNLGNAYFRSDQLGKAILNYERALLLIPRDADLNFNLRYARDLMTDPVIESRSFVRQTFFWLDAVTLSELFWTFAVLNVLFWGALVTRLFYRGEWNYYLSLVLLIFWLIASISFGLKWYQAETDARAVIVEEEANILAGPDVNDTVLFKLHEGSIVHFERSEDGWFLVSLPDKKRGWVEAKAVERIRS
jgi:tetratricopeptide (TPR) repeat protein